MGSRHIATVTALATYPVFYHSQAVRVRGAVSEQDGLFRLEQDGAQVWLVAAPSGRLPDAKTASEVTGTFLDVGRLEANDVPQRRASWRR